MRIVLIALMTASFVIPANARGKQRSGEQQPNAEQQKKARSQEEKDYKSALSRIPVQQPADPWGKMR